MREIIVIDGKEIEMEANGATPRIYRQMFGEDLFVALHGAVIDDEVANVECFENLAYCMAKQAGSVSEDIDTWLASFSTASAIVNAIGPIMALWNGNTKTIVAAKKKAK